MGPYRISGKRSDSTYFIEDGYVYKTRSSRNEIKYLNCVEAFCPGRAVLRSNDELHITSEHVHDADKGREEEFRYTHGIRRMAMNMDMGSTSFRNISDHQSSLYPLGSLHRGYYADRMIMYRSKREIIPPLPKSFQEVLITLSVDEKWEKLGFSLHTNEKFFLEIASASDGSEAAIFLSPFFKDLFLKGSLTLFLDSTFDSRPLNPPCAQLLAIHIAEEFLGDSYIYPCAYALMEKKSSECYIAVLESIKAAIGGPMNPTCAMCDYESALHNALRRLFPGIDLSGCWFHYCNAVYSMARELHIINAEYECDPATERCLLKCQALPLLPPASIADGLTVVESELQDLGLQNSFMSFVSYLRRTWFEDSGFGVDVVSLFELLERTNNSVESSHYQLFRKIGQVRPNFWDFLSALRRFDFARYQDRERVSKGIAVQPPKKPKYVRQNQNIKDMQQKLVDGELSVATFLDRACHTVEGLQKRKKKLDDNAELLM